MTPATQKRLAVAGVALGLMLVLGANAHLVVAAIRSQPPCIAKASAPLPAQPAC